MTSYEPPPRERDDDHTRPLDPVGPGESGESGGPTRPPLEATVQHRPPTADPTSQLGGPPPTGAYGQAGPRQPGPPEEAEPERDRRLGKGFALVLLGVFLGVVIAFIVIALTTDPTSTVELPSEAAMDRIEELEAEVAERDARIADLEAQLAEADADAGEADAAIAEQREALDALADELDARRDALNQRDETLTEREQAVAEREQAVAEREQALDEGEQPPDDGGIDLPELDDEQVEGIVEQILDRIRDLF